jgi:alpha-D-xyloside xylohydrolase
MFGPAFLVAPVTNQGITSRKVYLPAGADWYNYWTNDRIAGGQTITAAAPIDTMPLFVRAGSIVPLGEPIEHTGQPQKIAKLKIYPGANGSFTLYQDDGQTYAYERGENSVTNLVWNEISQTLTHQGPAAWTGPDAEVVQIAGRFNSP